MKVRYKEITKRGDRINHAEAYTSLLGAKLRCWQLMHRKRFYDIYIEL